MKQKKDTQSSISDIVFKILVAITVLVFIVILVTRSSDSYSVTQNKLRTTGDNNFGAPKKGDSKPAENVPSQLKWFDVFKGISND